jgi:hypothetical protein
MTCARNIHKHVAYVAYKLMLGAHATAEQARQRIGE